MEHYYTLKEVAQIIGISDRQLRRWDKEGKLVPHHVDDHLIRYYNDKQIEQARKLYLSPKDKKTKKYTQLETARRKLGLERCEIANILLISTQTWHHWEEYNQGTQWIIHWVQHDMEAYATKTEETPLCEEDRVLPLRSLREKYHIKRSEVTEYVQIPLRTLYYWEDNEIAPWKDLLLRKRLWKLSKNHS